jgi:hypothetical protein
VALSQNNEVFYVAVITQLEISCLFKFCITQNNSEPHINNLLSHTQQSLVEVLSLVLSQKQNRNFQVV